MSISTTRLTGSLRWLVAATVLVMASSAPWARASVLTVRQVSSTGHSIDSLTEASALLNGATVPTSDVTITSSALNFVDPELPARGRFHHDVAFPGNKVGSDDNDFAVSITGNVVIPSAGSWTFGTYADNGIRISVGPLVMSRSGFSSSTLLGNFDFPEAGTYPLSVTYYEHTGQAGVELFAAPGAITTGNNATFRLVGDVATGGLSIAPEPTGILPLALLGALILRRRRAA